MNNIKKIKLLTIINILINILLLNLNFNLLSFEEIKTSKSFLYYRPAYFNLPARHSLWSQMFYEKQYTCKGVFQFVPIYQKSAPIKNQHLARYFLLNCKPEIIIAGDNSPNSQNRDVRAEWFYLDNKFDSLFSLDPQQKQLAFIFNFNQDLKNWTNIEYFRDFWLDLNIPVLTVKNNIEPLGRILNDSGTISELFNALQNIPISSKITSSSLENTKIAEIKLTLGTRWYYQNNFFLAVWGSLIAPGAKWESPKYLFNSVIGTNGHWGMATGIRAEFPLFYCLENYFADLKPWIFLDIENQYFFINKQCRTFDLKHKQWSRYLQYRKPNQIDTITGTKILTLDTWVNPHNMVDLTTGIMVRFSEIEFQVGYSLWARQRETLSIVRPECTETGYAFEHFGIAGAAPKSSAKKSTIKEQAAEDQKFKFIHRRDINLCSAAFPGGSSNRIYSFIGFNKFDYNNCDSSFAFGALGGFYEWAHTNSAFTNWGLWIKFGLSL